MPAGAAQAVFRQEDGCFMSLGPLASANPV
ncbi:hypothetical protein Z046_07485 [Pseudomonas aeruginosa VRFPA09]|nr:hypothetical protein U769_06265 [Pseudomonas aeruginosa MTB-1]EQL39358.1 hypothetical protein M770_23330 [Pseudomonas aeruginosa VRFPA03]ESR69250.1 hypothetical protein T266_21520 [Pseudomonas aeruginosa VRFPA05]ETD56754.1 hypothetical protein X778_02330 [Pseudomonas aeruginosa VRFPA07]EVT88592.1 hypothetical protein Z046_07485 [Pseudomonas aeruginosa VRFPA09]